MAKSQIVKLFSTIMSKRGICIYIITITMKGQFFKLTKTNLNRTKNVVCLISIII